MRGYSTASNYQISVALRQKMSLRDKMGNIEIRKILSQLRKISRREFIRILYIILRSPRHPVCWHCILVVSGVYSKHLFIIHSWQYRIGRRQAIKIRTYSYTNNITLFKKPGICRQAIGCIAKALILLQRKYFNFSIFYERALYVNSCFN